MINPVQHPILFEPPRRTAPSGWTGHIPFGMLLVELVEPRLLVELGTYSGVSYCAFCQAVHKLDVPTRCYAVDTWEGDPQTGFYGPQILKELRAHHDPLYGDFSRLLKTTFDSALQNFEDGSIDLLHMDGLHSYPSVKKDWENWLPKISERGVVVLHDISVRKDGFEVWKLWEELKPDYPHFELTHEHGLGLLAVGEDHPPVLGDLVHISNQERERLQTYFAHLGDKLHESLRLQELEAFTAQGSFQDLSRRMEKKEDRLHRIESELSEIKSSRAWQLTQILWRLRLKLISPGSIREDIVRRVINLVWRKDGGKQGERGPGYDDPPSRSRSWDRDVKVETHVRQDEVDGKQQARMWWDDYLDLTSDIDEIKLGKQIQGQSGGRGLIDFDEGELAQHAQRIQFPHVDRPQVSIIIPVWNYLQLTLECLASVQKHTTGTSYEVIVIDDGSDDQTPSILPLIDNLRVQRNQERSGFVMSCNKGSQFARGEYILFLNNDVQVTENWLSALVEPFEARDDVGAVGGKILFPDGRLQEAGAVVSPDGTTQLVGLYEDPSLPRYNYLREVEYVSGVCLMVRKGDFEEMGGFSGEFQPAYGEDVDFCLWLREKGKRILYQPQAEIIHHLSATTDTLGEDVKAQLATAHAQVLMEKWGEHIEEGASRLISFYLPQYHPIQENDLWWGRGFTDWRNVVDTVPNFEGHDQPHLPADVGFYDLRVEEVLEQQAKLARRYGISGFCFHYYWFGGRTLLESPLRRILEKGQSPIPFCLCWANENWTRTWDGHQDQILISQNQGDSEVRNFITDIAPYLKHPDYIRVNGKPLLLIYRMDLIPDVQATVQYWRQFCLDQDIGELYLVMVETFEHGMEPDQSSPASFGCDASVEFPPHPFDHDLIAPPGDLQNPHFSGTIHDYQQAALGYLRSQAPNFPRFRGVMPGWDNTPRRQNEGTAYVGGSPGSYQAWLEAALEFTREQFVRDERLVFINAWNEWAEGAHLEPDLKVGHGYLEATRNALQRDLLWKKARGKS